MIKPYSLPFTLWQIDALLEGGLDAEAPAWREDAFAVWFAYYGEEIASTAWSDYLDENQNN